MSEIKVRALVLRSVDSKEYDKTVTLCTAEAGQITATMKGCKKPTAKMSFGARPFLFGEYVLAEKNGRYTVTACSPIESFLNVRSVEDYFTASAVIDVLYLITRECDNASDMLVLALRTLSLIGVNDGAVLIGFLIGAMRLSGLEVNTRTCCICGKEPHTSFFSMTDGGLVCEDCATGSCVKISGQTAGYIRLLGDGDLHNNVRIPRSSVVEAVGLFSDFFAYNTGERSKGLVYYLTTPIPEQ